MAGKPKGVRSVISKTLKRSLLRISASGNAHSKSGSAITGMMRLLLVSSASNDWLMMVCPKREFKKVKE